MIKEIKFSSLILIGFLLLNQGCKLREVVSPASSPLIDTSALDTIWRSEIQDGSITPIINSEGNVLSSKTFTNPLGEVFELRDGKSGRLIWQWSDYLTPEFSYRGASIIFYKDVVVLSKSFRTYAFDAITGKTLWRDEQKGLFGDKSMAIDDDGFIYHSFKDIDQKNRNIYIWRTRFDNLKWEQVCVYSDTVDNNKISSMNMVVAKNTKGEKLLVYTPVMFRTINGENRPMSKVVAYNINLKKIEWQVDYNPDISNIQFWNTDMVVNQDKIYVFAVSGTEYFLMVYKIEDGKLAFSQPLENYGVGLHFYKGIVIPLINGNTPVTAYDANTGVKKWTVDFFDKSNHEINFDFYDSKLYKNFLISTQCSKMLAINLDIGKV
ncbi:MAG: hypothetical protein Q8R57_01085, partial [Bacteroidota bacterium]|nr:hypothetical protein [Bacteroidota bacterium]